MQVIVYAGAVMVLFVFVIMLLNAGAEERLSQGSRVATMLGVPALIIGLGIAAALRRSHRRDSTASPLAAPRS